MSSEKRTLVPNSLNEHWMPFTSNKDFKENPKLIVEAKGGNWVAEKKTAIRVATHRGTRGEFNTSRRCGEHSRAKVAN